MIFPLQFFRVLRIYYVLMRYMVNRPVFDGQSWWLRGLSYLNPLSFLKQKKTRGESIRVAIESLGPIFVKFGQILSIRQDLLSEDIIAELSKLQDQVPPFSEKKAVAIVEQSLQQPLSAVFSVFNKHPLASASVAQVHAATLHDGSEVVVKVLRPNIEKTIRNDIALLYFVARLTQKLWSQGKRLRPVELVAEFEETIIGELDLMREAANASQLRRNFLGSPIMSVPKVHWPYTRSNVMVMERIRGVPIANIDELKAKGTNMKELAERGVAIFFTQVFRDSFFHADMHPGNLFVDVSDPENPQYLGVDFGIMGTLGPEDQHYLAENILAFFYRDYRRIAVLHVESGWVAPDTRIDQFETAIRTVSEPIFEMPLSQISFGQLLMKLFQTAKRFNMEVQPQLMLLQKTLFNIEGLGRKLYPELDLWQTAKPFMEDWAKKRRSLKKIAASLNQEWHGATEKIIKMPQLVFNLLDQVQQQQRGRRIDEDGLLRLKKKQRYGFMLGVGSALLVVGGIALLVPAVATGTWKSVITALGGALLLLSPFWRPHS